MKHVSVMTDRELYEAIITNIKKSFAWSTEEEYSELKREADDLKDEVIGRGEHCLAGYALFLLGEEEE